MNVEHLRKIIAYSDKNREDIYSMVKRFCAFARIEYDSDFLNILQIVRSSIRARLQFDVGAFIMRKIVEIAKNRFRKREYLLVLKVFI